MAQNYQLSSVFFTALALSVLAHPVRAEVACVAEVSYRWIKEQSTATDAGAPAQASSRGASGGSSSVGAASTSSATAPSGSTSPHDGAQGEQRVRFAQVERRGQDERAVKAGLQIEVNRQKARAHERCKRDHESFGDCVSTKMSTQVATLNSLSFSARSKVEEALIEECRVQQGRCSSVDSEEPTCRDLVAGAVAAPATAPTGAPGGASEAAKAEGGDTKGAAKEPAKTTEPAADKAKSAKKKP